MSSVMRMGCTSPVFPLRRAVVPEVYGLSSAVGVAHFVILARWKPMHLYETHVAVTDTQASEKFYVDVVGLQAAYRDPARDSVFLWIGTGRRSMLGLWGPITMHGRDPHRCHLAIALSLPELLLAGQRLNGGSSTFSVGDGCGKWAA